MSAQASQTPWYLARDGQQFGPLSDAELAKFIELGHLQPTDLLWREGFPDWRPAMVVFPPPRAPAPQRSAAPMRPAQQQPVASPRIDREPAPRYRGNAGSAPPAKQTGRGEHVRHDELEEESEPHRGGGLKKVLLIVVCLALLGGAGWYAFPHRVALMAIAKALSARLTAVVGGMVDGKGQEGASLKGLGDSPDTIDARLQATRLWRVVKAEFPDWYAERLKEAAAMAGESKEQADIAQQLARALVGLRRQNAKHALAADIPQVKSVAQTFYENLVQLRKHSSEACFALISRGEASPVIVSLMQSSSHAALLQAQMTAVFEAIADGRKKVRTYPEPRRTDYDVLKADLVKRGWTDADFQLFTDAQALARATPEKVCQLVHDWFAAHFEIKDADMQLRLLVETIKPVVGG
jgi:GYF domain 2